jgi:hypothetical protein
MSRLRRVLTTLSFCSVFFGCGPQITRSLNFNPTEPLRLAVLPFLYQEEGKMQAEVAPPTSNLLIDSINPLASAPNGTPTQLVRSYFHDELLRTSFDVVPQFAVEASLAHAGFTNKKGEFLQQKIHALSPSQICKQLMDCDAVLYGIVREWDRNYYGIESVSSVDIDITIRSARTGEVMFAARGTDSDRRGITGGPTGFSDLLIEPIKGLDSDNIEKLAQQTVKALLEPLAVKTAEHSPQSLSIYAVASDGKAGVLTPSDSLLVLLYGSSQQQASFSIGTAIQNVPMVEKFPGHYVGEYFPLAGEDFHDAMITVELRDPAGRSSVSVVPETRLTLKQ